MKPASDELIPGRFAISVGDPGTPTPDGWSRVLLTKIARMESGHTPSRQHPEYWNGDVPWLGIVDARHHHGRTIGSTLQTITEKGLANSAARWLPSGTVCLSRTASVGYVTILGRRMATSQDFVNWVCGDAIDPKFLMYALMAEGEHIREFGKGSTHTTIYFPAALAFHVDLPPIEEQHRIVAKVELLYAELGRAKARFDRVPQLLKRFRQSVLLAACSGKLTDEWRKKNAVAHPTAHRRDRARTVKTRKAVPEHVEMPPQVEGVELPDSWEKSSVAQLLRNGTLLDVKDGNHGANHPKSSEPKA